MNPNLFYFCYALSSPNITTIKIVKCQDDVFVIHNLSNEDVYIYGFMCLESIYRVDRSGSHLIRRCYAIDPGPGEGAGAVNNTSNR